MVVLEISPPALFPFHRVSSLQFSSDNNNDIPEDCLSVLRCLTRASPVDSLLFSVELSPRRDICLHSPECVSGCAVGLFIFSFLLNPHFPSAKNSSSFFSPKNPSSNWYFPQTRGLVKAAHHE